MSSTLLTKLSSPEEVKEYLLKKGITEKICEDFYNNDICGQAFFNLTESDLKEMVPSIGVRTKVREILKEHRKDEVIEPSHQSPSMSSTSMPNETGAVAITPCSSSSWHHSFQIPDKDKFSGCVQEAISSGVITTKARREIIQTLRTLIIQYTQFPTAEQYTAVCQKLIIKFPKLQDMIGSNGYGSWKESLRTSFKNFRRPHSQNASTPKRKADEDLQSTPKRLLHSQNEDESITMEEYDEIVEQLKLEWKKGKKKRNKSVIKTCMEKTSILRQKWVMEEKPLISQVLCKFPPLRESRQIRKEFCSIVDKENLKNFKEEWPEWISRVIRFARIDASSRPLISKLLRDFG